MKNLLFLFLVVLATHSLQAQYCGSSPAFPCTVVDTSGVPGYYPGFGDLAPFYNNVLASVSLQFTNFDSIAFGTEVLYAYSTTIDSINNLPAGLCWTTNEDTNTFKPGQTGCIKIEGIPCDFTGQYKIPTILTLLISGGTTVETDGDAGGLEYFIRLNNTGDAIFEVDSAQTDSTPVLYYGGICEALPPLAIAMDTGGNFCNGSILYLNPTVTGGLPPYMYSWQSSGSILNCDSCSNPQLILNSNSTFVLNVTDFDGNTASDTARYTVSGPEYNFQISADGPVAFCDSGQVTLVSQTGTAATYQWLFNGAAITGATDSTYDATNASGGYSLQYSLPGCTAASNIIPVSFFNATPALIMPLGSTTLCSGDTIILQANYGAQLSYQWLYNGSSVISYSLQDTVTQPGSYQLVVTNALSCTDTSASITVISSSNAPPQVSFTYYSGDTLCASSQSFALTGGNPPGGNYSGAGVSGNIFYPGSAIAGANIITYAYVDSNNCSSLASDTIVVEVCTGIENNGEQMEMMLYPNPTGGVLYIESPVLEENYVIELYDAAGRRFTPAIYRSERDDKIMLNLTSLPKGIYVIELSAGEKMAKATFVKAK